MMAEVAGGVLIAASICGVFMLGRALVADDEKWAGRALMVVALLAGFVVIIVAVQ